MHRVFQLYFAVALLLNAASAQFGHDTVTYHGVSPAVRLVSPPVMMERH